MNNNLTAKQIVELYKTGVKIEDILGMSQFKYKSTIYRKLKKEGISPDRNKKIELSDKEIKEMINIYNSSPDMSAEKIGKMYNISGDSVLRILREHSIAVRVQPRKHQINESFFDTLNETVAYVVGLIITDGTIHKDLKGFSIIQKDYDLLKKISYTMGAAEGIIYEHDSGVHSLIVRSEKMTNSLIKNFNLHPNKSKTIEMPKISKRFYPGLLRGSYDGDGHFGKREVSLVTASENFALSLYDILQGYNLNPKLNLEKPKKTWLFRVYVRGKDNIKRLGNILYGNEDTLFKVSRKKDFLNAYGGIYD